MYFVTVKEVIIYDALVEADSAKEAKAIAKQMLMAGELVECEQRVELRADSL